MCILLSPGDQLSKIDKGINGQKAGLMRMAWTQSRLTLAPFAGKSGTGCRKQWREDSAR